MNQSGISVKLRYISKGVDFMFNGRAKVVVFLSFLLCLFVYDITIMSSATAATNFNSAQVQDINILLKQKKYRDAYQLAQLLSPQKIGEPSFDLLFGEAALVAKKPDVASLAFERVLMSNPKNVTAKLGLAESYYGLKMYDKAKVEAQALTAGSYGLGFDKEIKKLLTKVNRDASSVGDKSYGIYGKMVFGYDNNVAASTDEDYGRYLDLTGASYDKTNADQVAAYNSLYRQLEQSNKQLKSLYVYPQLGIGGKYSPKAKYNLFWDVNASHKAYTDVGGYNIDQANFSFGMNYQLTPLYLLNGSFYYQEYMLGGKKYRETPLGAISLSRVLNANNVLKIYTNNGVLSYPNNTSLSVNMLLGGLEWSCFNSRNLLVTQTFYGKNKARGGANTSNSNNYYGVDISAKHQLTQKVSLTANAIYQRSLYAGIEFNTPLAPVRRDSFGQFSAGVYYKFNPHYTWYALGSYTNTNSNIFIYKYDRLEVLTGLSFEF